MIFTLLFFYFTFFFYFFFTLHYFTKGAFEKQKISDLKAWMKLWKFANEFEGKDLAEKCMERNAASPMMELSAFKQKVSEPARKKQCIVCIKK